jgi:hypothetical protein
MLRDCQEGSVRIDREVDTSMQDPAASHGTRASRQYLLATASATYALITLDTNIVAVSLP